MLRELRIRNYAIIDEVSLEFSEGFNVITGETGAGKSILVDALSLILGGRASPESVRQGGEEAILEARFDFLGPPPSPENKTSEWLILKRILSKSAKSRAYLNSSFANLSDVEKIGQKLAEIHGQHEHHNLTDLHWQLLLLDAFGRLHDSRSQYRALYQRWSQLLKERDDLLAREAEGKRQEAFLQFQLAEIKEAKLSPDEEESLEREENVLKNWETVLSSAQKAYTLLSEEEGILTRLYEAGREIKSLNELTKDAAPELQLWETARIHLKELGSLLRGRSEGIEYDPDRLGRITERLYLIQKLKKKYGSSVEAVLNYQQKVEEELSRLSRGDARLKEIETEAPEIEKSLKAGAETLSKKRYEAKFKLEEKVKEELYLLGMEKTTFEISFTRGALSEMGADQIEFLIAGPGEPPQGLAKIASGGELSRIMLALKVALAEVDPVPTLVFDEVDAGIGGGVAEKVGKRLSHLSQKHQVFCITHLPQIARFAKSHYFVEKDTAGKRVATSIKKLSEEERIQELARMLGGVSITPITLRHAEEMARSTTSVDLPIPPPPTKQSKKERSK